MNEMRCSNRYSFRRKRSHVIWCCRRNSVHGNWPSRLHLQTQNFSSSPNVKFTQHQWYSASNIFDAFRDRMSEVEIFDILKSHTRRQTGSYIYYEYWVGSPNSLILKTQTTHWLSSLEISFAQRIPIHTRLCISITANILCDAINENLSSYLFNAYNACTTMPQGHI